MRLDTIIERIMKRIEYLEQHPFIPWASHFADAFRYLAVGHREYDEYLSPPQEMADNEYNPLGSYVA